MKTVQFKIGTETSNQNSITEKSFDAFLHLTDTTATFFFDEEINLSEKEKGNKFKVSIKAQITNPIGFIISRIERFTQFNSAFKIVEIDNKTIYLKNDVICKSDVHDLTFLAGMEVSKTSRVIISIVDNGESVNSTFFSFDQIKDDGLSLSVKTISLPSSVDCYGNALYCREPRINRALQNAMVSVNDANIKDMLKQLNEHAKRISAVAKLLKKQNVSVLNYMFISRYICDVPQKQWKTKLVTRSTHTTIIDDYKFFKNHNFYKNRNNPFNFRIDDLINLYE